jgi:hypothetical protein
MIETARIMDLTSPVIGFRQHGCFRLPGVINRDRQGGSVRATAGKERSVTASFPFPHTSHACAVLQQAPGMGRRQQSHCGVATWKYTQWRAMGGRCNTAPFLKSGNSAYCLSFI